MPDEKPKTEWKWVLVGAMFMIGTLSFNLVRLDALPWKTKPEPPSHLDQYFFDDITIAGNRHPIRINKKTGETEILYGYGIGWRPAGKPVRPN